MSSRGSADKTVVSSFRSKNNSMTSLRKPLLASDVCSDGDQVPALRLQRARSHERCMMPHTTTHG